MTRVSPLGTMVLLFGMVLLAVLGTLLMLSSIQTVALPTVHQQVSVDWLPPDQVWVPSNLIISQHATKHNGEAEKIYQMLLEGKCTEVQKFCGGSESEFAYYCVDPVTGIVGAILQFGDEVTTGFYEREGSDYWVKRASRDKWEVCQ